MLLQKLYKKLFHTAIEKNMTKLLTELQFFKH